MIKIVFITVLILYIFYIYGKKRVNEGFSPDIVEMLDNFDIDTEECPKGCSGQIQMNQILSKLNSVQSDVSDIDKTTKGTKKQVEDTQAYLKKLEAEIRKDFANMEKEISSGISHKG